MAETDRPGILVGETQFLFLLGRPGSGKSHVFHQVAGLLPESPSRIDDFPKLQALADQDDAAESAGSPRQFTKTADGGWLATQVAYETVLRDIDSELRQRPNNGFVFVEFARWDMVRSIEDNFSKDVLNRSFLIYVYCPLSICIKRNALRRPDTGTQPTEERHEVPPDRLMQRYRDDDHDALDRLSVPYLLIDNHFDDTEHLKFEAQKIVRALVLRS